MPSHTDARLSPAHRLRMSERIAKLRKWIKFENELYDSIPDVARDGKAEHLHLERLAWFNSEIEMERAKCPHPPVARYRLGVLFPEMGPGTVACADCGKELTESSPTPPTQPLPVSG